MSSSKLREMFDPRGPREVTFNRFFVVLMFAVISTIGSAAVCAMVISQHSGDRASTSYHRANDARLMALALDQEQLALVSFQKGSGSQQPGRPAEATAVFDSALDAFERDASSDAASASVLSSDHDAYARASRAAVAALARGDRQQASLIETRDVRPNFDSMHRLLATISTTSFSASAREESRDRDTTTRIERLIACVTIFALLLMAWLATLLARYKQTAVRAAQEKLASLQQALREIGVTPLLTATIAMIAGGAATGQEGV